MIFRVVKIFIDLIISLPPKWLVMIFFGLIGLPASCFSLAIYEMKYAKQSLDCVTDIDYAINASGVLEDLREVKSLSEIPITYSSCVNNIDSKKGNVKFLTEQYQRHEAGRL